MRKNVAGQAVSVQMLASDGSAFTGAVVAYVMGNNGAQVIGSVGGGACTHKGNGVHTYAPAQAETNFDHVAFTFIGSGVSPTTVQVYPAFPQTGDTFARLGAPVGASTSADLAAVKADTAGVTTLLTRVPGLVPVASDWTPARAVRLDNLDALITSRSSYAGTDTAGVTTLLTRVPGLVPVAADYSPARAARLDNVDVAVSTCATAAAVAAIPPTAAPAAATVAAAVQGLLDDDFAALLSAVLSRLASSSYAAPDNAGLAAVKAKTDLLPADPASQAVVLAAIGNVSGGGGGGGGADPLLAAVPGTYAAGTAGAALGKLNAVAPAAPVVVVPGVPAEQGLCRVYAYLETVDNLPAANVEVEFTLVTAGVTASERLIAGRTVAARTDAQGASG